MSVSVIKNMLSEIDYIKRLQTDSIVYSLPKDKVTLEVSCKVLLNVINFTKFLNGKGSKIHFSIEFKIFI